MTRCHRRNNGRQIGREAEALGRSREGGIVIRGATVGIGLEGWTFDGTSVLLDSSAEQQCETGNSRDNEKR